MSLENMLIARAAAWVDLLAIARQGFREAVDAGNREWADLWHNRSITLLRGNQKERIILGPR